MATVKATVSMFESFSTPFANMERSAQVVIEKFDDLRAKASNAVDPAKILDAIQKLAEMASAVESIQTSIQKLDGQQQQLNSSVAASEDAAVAFREKMTTATDKIQEGVKGIGEKQEKVNKRFDDGGKAAKAFWGQIKGIASTIGKIVDIKKTLDLSDQMTNIRTRLNVVLDDGGSVSELEKKIMGAAVRSRAAYLDTAAAVTKLGATAGGAFSGSDEMVGFVEQANKMFALGGATAQEQSAAMGQLTQAMTDGVLKGDNLNAVLSAAPGIASAIEQYMGVTEGSIGSVAAQGLITADVLKNAMFSAAGETNTAFDALPMTWSQIWTTMQNKALSAFNPLLAKINEVGNSESFKRVTDGLANGLAAVAQFAMWVLTVMVDVAAWITNNWEMIAPVIWAVIAAMLIYGAVSLVTNIITGIGAFITRAHAAATALKNRKQQEGTTATWASVVAQYGLNAAFLACPLVWITLVIIAVIMAIYLLVGWLNRLAGTSDSATGIIAGAFFLLAAFVYNKFYVPARNAVAAFINFFANVFNDPIAAVKMLFLDLAQTAIGYLQTLFRGIETLVNKIPGVQIDITSGLDTFAKELEETSQKVKAESGWKAVVSEVEYWEYEDAENAGRKFGQGIDDTMSNMFNFDNMDDLGASLKIPGLDDLYQNTADTADNTAATADALDIAEEDLGYLRDMAEREAINRFTTAEIRIEQHNQNNISADTDLDGLMTAWTYDFAEKLENSPEGLHE